VAHRTCDRCHRRMEPYRPRFTEDDGDRVCEGCHNGRPGRPLTGSKHEAAIRVEVPTVADAPFIRIGGALVRTAHQSGDGVTIYHCPFCGSGQVIAGSDGTVECDFCSTTFIVQVQPEKSSMPQTINGVPFQAPGMPPVGQDPGAKPGEPTPAEEDENKSFGGDDLSEKAHDPKDGPDPKDPAAGGKSPFPPKKTDEKTDDKPKGDDDKSGGSKPPWLTDKKSGLFLTAEGVALPLDKYMAHLALKETEDREATLQEVNQSNEGQ
jgi:predicted CXXCH cytochrome family protein